MTKLAQCLSLAIATAMLSACGGGGSSGGNLLPPSDGSSSSSSSSSSASSAASSSTSSSSGSGSGSSTSGSSSTSSSSGGTSSTSSSTSSGGVTGPVFSAKVGWDIPDSREDGSDLQLSEIAGYEIQYRTSAELAYSTVVIYDQTQDEIQIDDLPAGQYEVVVSVFDTDGLYSDYSEPAIAIIGE